jgi:phage terminase large subunit-like protein
VQRYHVILLGAWRGKVPFSAFKRIAIDGFKEYQPDRILIEKKASGHSLIQELRKGSLPVKPVNPDKSKETLNKSPAAWS